MTANSLFVNIVSEGIAKNFIRGESNYQLSSVRSFPSFKFRWKLINFLAMNRGKLFPLPPLLLATLLIALLVMTSYITVVLLKGTILETKCDKTIFRWIAYTSFYVGLHLLNFVILLTKRIIHFQGWIPKLFIKLSSR